MSSTLLGEAHLPVLLSSLLERFLRLSGIYKRYITVIKDAPITDNLSSKTPLQCQQARSNTLSAAFQGTEHTCCTTVTHCLVCTHCVAEVPHVLQPAGLLCMVSNTTHPEGHHQAEDRGHRLRADEEDEEHQHLCMHAFSHL